jgi:hypothetical protein
LLYCKDNLFVCSLKINGVKDIKKNKLILYEFINEKDEKFEIKKKCSIEGNYSIISNTSLILDCFLISSSARTNSLIKITNDKINLSTKFKLGKKYTNNKNVYNEEIKINLFN